MDNPANASENSGSKILPGWLELSADLKLILKKQINCDLILHVGNRTVKCHKAILRARCSWFASEIDHPYSLRTSSIIVNENEQILDALLMYIYTGDLYLVGTLKVPLVDLWLAAKKYGLNRLRKVIIRWLDNDKNIDFYVDNFCWPFYINDCRYDFQELSLNYTMGGTNPVSLAILSPYFHDSEDTYHFRLRVTKKPRKDNENLFLIMILKIKFVGGTETVRRSFVFNHIFKKDCDVALLEDFALPKAEADNNNICRGGIFQLRGELTVGGVNSAASQRMLFEVSDCPKTHQGADWFYELQALSDDMFELLNESKYTDMGISVLKNSTRLKANVEAKYTDTELDNHEAKFHFEAKVHSYILGARSLIPIQLIGSLVEHFGCKTEVWTSFLNYLYTGERIFLKDHMREVYVFAWEQQLAETKRRYSRILAENLTTSNCSYILTDAIKYNDCELSCSVKHFVELNN